MSDGNGHSGSRTATAQGAAGPAFPLAAVPAPLLRIGADGRVVDASAAAVQQLAPEGDVVGRALDALVAAERGDAVREALAAPGVARTLVSSPSGRLLALDVAAREADGCRLVGLLPAVPGTDTQPGGHRPLAEVLLEIDEGFVLFDTTPTIVECNEASLRILGTTREELIGKPSLTEAGFPIVRPDGELVGAPDGPVGLCLRTGEPVEDVVIQVETARGRRWMKASVRPIRGADGRVEHVVTYFTDVSHAREIEARLDLAERRFGTLVEQLPLVVYVDEPDLLASNIYVSPQVEPIFGVSQEVFGDNERFWEMVHPDDRARVRQLVASQLGSDDRFVDEYRLNLPDGRTVWVRDESMVIRDELGTPLYVQGYYLDVTEERAAAEALRLERERFAQLAENIEELFYVFDVPERRFVYMSPAYERLTGHAAEDVYANPLSYLDPVHPDDRALVTPEAFAEQGSRGVIEFRFVRPDGAVGWLLSRWFPVTDDDGLTMRVVGLAQDVTERKLAQEALDEERVRFRQLVENIQDIFWIYDLEERRHVFMSPRFGQVTGRSLEELERDPDVFLASVVEEDLELAREMTRARDRGEAFEAEFRLRRSDGSVSWMWDRSFPVVRDGRVVRVAGISEDITERKLAAQELAEQQERFQQLAEASTGMFWVYDIALGRHVYMSPAWERVTGLPLSEALAEPNRMLDLVHPDDRERVAAANELRDLGVATEEEFRYHRQDGTVGWLWRRSFPVVEGDRVVRLAGLAEDVTERRLQQLELERERERFLTLADNIDDVFWILDTVEGRITYLSPAFEDVFGVPREELYRCRSLYLELVHPEHRHAARAMNAQQEAGVTTVTEYRVVHPDGSERWIRDRAVPIVEDGRVVRVAGIAEDVTDRRRRDAERAELTRRWRELFTDAPVMYLVCAYDAQGRLVIEDANNALLEALERGREEVVGQLVDAFYDDASAARLWETGVLAEPFRGRERTLVSRSGRRVDVLVDVMPAYGPDGEITSIRGTLTDITAKKAVEERLRADAEALGRLGGLAASEEGIDVKLEQVLRIAVERFGFPFGAVVALPREGEGPAPIAMVDDGDEGLQLAAASLRTARVMLEHPVGEVRVEPADGNPELRVVGLPLGDDDAFRGVMVFAAGAGAFDAGERELLALMAQWARYELARDRAQAEVRESEEVHRSLSESLRRLGERVEAVREDERTRIAREVHDELGQALTALKLDLHWLQDRVEGDASVRLTQMIDTVEQTIDAVRRVCADLRPPMLDDLGLVAALEWHAANVRRASGIACHVLASGAGDRAVSSQVATEAFRITQEALTNVARHAAASSVDVHVHVGSAELELRIEDDGEGIDTGAMSTGLGILGMRERALRLNGSLVVEPVEEGGTRVVLRVPLDIASA